MNNSKLVAEAKSNPGRIYHRPHDLLRDRRLQDADRLEILSAWEERARQPTPPPQEASAAASLQELELVRRELEGRLDPQSSAGG
jgi:hypothetical protein